jgi:hypothetical protein
MDRWLLPRPEDVLVDKQNNKWVLTYRVNDQTTLRLRLRHIHREDGNDAICEIGEGSGQPFREVGRMMFAPSELDPSIFGEVRRSLVGHD